MLVQMPPVAAQLRQQVKTWTHVCDKQNVFTQMLVASPSSYGLLLGMGPLIGGLSSGRGSPYLAAISLLFCRFLACRSRRSCFSTSCLSCASLAASSLGSAVVDLLRLANLCLRVSSATCSTMAASTQQHTPSRRALVPLLRSIHWRPLERRTQFYSKMTECRSLDQRACIQGLYSV